MKISLTKGFAFGITSGVITTLGLIVGLHSGTHSELVVLSGILTIAIADAFSDALGMHVSQESEKNSQKSIWESTIATFIAKFVVAMSFMIPILTIELTNAIFVSIAWGLLLIGIFSYYIAKQNKDKASRVIAEHVGIALVVVIAAHFVGDIIGIMLK